MSQLTPYDTGERLEPRLWVTSSSGMGKTRDPDDWGRVDFDNDESATEFTIYVENKGGDRIIHIIDHAQMAYTIDIDDQDLRFKVPA